MNLMQKNTRKQGDVGIGRAIAYFTGLGHSVSIPLTESQRYDLIVDDGEQLSRIEVKTTRYKRDGAYNVLLSTQGGNQSWKGTIKKFSKEHADYVFVVVDDDTQYLLPSELVDGKGAIRLGSKYAQYMV